MHWADLAMPITASRWIRFVYWGLAMSGARVYDVSPASVKQGGLRSLPRELTPLERKKVRLELLGVSMLFLLILLTLYLINILLARLSIKIPPLEKAQTTVYDYIGGVKLYQDWFIRKDGNLEAIGEKSRMAIRRRMVRAILRTAEAVRRGEIDGYYIFAHSLGTVVAFNGLMELEGILPRYLTEEEWNELNPTFKGTNANQELSDHEPNRPPWIQPSDIVKREQVFAGLRGFLTMGSPLNKFAALWPLIVPINAQPLLGNAHWINAADRQDIIAGSLDLFSRTGNIGGLQMTDIKWADQFSPFTAHTSYWNVSENNSRQRLFDRLIPWLEGNTFRVPDNRFSPRLSSYFLWFWIGFSSLLLLWILTSGLWFLNKLFHF